MLSFIFKFTIGFLMSFVILSIEFSSQPLFYHLSKLTTPYTIKVQKVVLENLKDGFDKSKELGKELFDNSKPKYFNDEIKSKQSSIKNKKIPTDAIEEIRDEERQQMNSFF